jgi:peptide/nickel transport system permease protein
MTEAYVEPEVMRVASRGRRRRAPIVMSLCFIVAGGVLVMAVFAGLLTPYAPGKQNVVIALQHPSGAHWLGTDSLGRDVLSRMIVGARSALIGPLVIAAGSMVLGNILGLLAGYRGGRVDAAIMRTADLFWSIPSLLVLVVVAGTFNGGYWLAVGLLTVLTTPFDTRVVRGATLEQVPRPYIEAARSLGVSDLRIMFFHIWPNISPVVVANTFLIYAGALVGLSGLSFIGLGVPPGTPDWGLMLAEGRQLIFLNPVASLVPGAMIAILATSMSLIGDWTHERLVSRGATR